MVFEGVRMNPPFWLASHGIGYYNVGYSKHFGRKLLKIRPQKPSEGLYNPKFSWGGHHLRIPRLAMLTLGYPILYLMYQVGVQFCRLTVIVVVDGHIIVDQYNCERPSFAQAWLHIVLKCLPCVCTPDWPFITYCVAYKCLKLSSIGVANYIPFVRAWYQTLLLCCEGWQHQTNWGDHSAACT